MADPPPPPTPHPSLSLSQSCLSRGGCINKGHAAVSANNCLSDLKVPALKYSQPLLSTRFIRTRSSQQRAHSAPQLPPPALGSVRLRQLWFSFGPFPPACFWHGSIQSSSGPQSPCYGFKRWCRWCCYLGSSWPPFSSALW